MSAHVYTTYHVHTFYTHAHTLTHTTEMVTYIYTIQTNTHVNQYTQETRGPKLIYAQVGRPVERAIATACIGVPIIILL